MELMIHASELEMLLRDFYTLTHLRIAVFDGNFREIACYPSHHSTYCQLVRAIPAAHQKCAKCDREACLLCRQKKHLIRYLCHAGMTEAVTPILQEETILGYIMFGQVLQTENSTASWEKAAPALAACTDDLSSLKAAYLHQRILPEETLTAAAKIMEACAGYLHLSHVMELKRESLVHQLENELKAHLAEDLDIPGLCNRYGLSRTRLYELAAQNFGEGVAEHLRTLRMEKAARLLLETDAPVKVVAVQVGYADYNYFTKVFGRHFGQPPRDYRKNSVHCNRPASTEATSTGKTSDRELAAEPQVKRLASI